MWHTDSLWFEIAVVALLFAVGNILLGHFEERNPKWRRLLKLGSAIGITILLSATVGRPWAIGYLGLLLLGAAVIHIWWLPKHGINGWTGEPREKYYALRGWPSNSAAVTDD